MYVHCTYICINKQQMPDKQELIFAGIQTNKL